MRTQISSQLAQQIVDTLKTICSHDINFIDVQGRICASTDPARVDGYHEGGHRAAQSGEIITIEADDPHRELRRGINMPIRFHGDTVAVIGITGEPGEVALYANLAQRITLLLLREHEIDARDYDNRTQTGFLVRALVDGETVTPEFIAEVLSRNGLPDRAELWRTAVIRLQPSHEHLLSEIESAVQEVVSRAGRCLSTYRFPSEYFLLIRDAELQAWERALRALAARFPRDLKIGIGSRRRLARQALSHQAARLAMQSLEAGENFAAYESVRLELLLGSVSEAAAGAYLEKCLTGLDRSDRELLEVYFAMEMSLKATAERCYLHVNTLQYRLNRIRDRCGLDPRRFRDASALHTALRLEALRAGGEA